MTSDKDKYIEERYAEYQKKWAEIRLNRLTAWLIPTAKKYPYTITLLPLSLTLRRRRGIRPMRSSGISIPTREKTFFRKFGE